jgi:hypothetical protein
VPGVHLGPSLLSSPRCFDHAHRILLDKIGKIPGGDPLWASLAIDLARRMGVSTPRRIIGFLEGRTRLNSGHYQEDVLVIEETARKEKALLKTVNEQ